MELNPSTLWNLATFAVSLIVILYAYRLFESFRKGQLSHGYAYVLAAICVLSATYFVSFLLSIEGISPVMSFGISVKDVGSLAALALLGVALMTFFLYWWKPRSSKPELIASTVPD